MSADTGESSEMHRDFKWVYTNILAEKVTLALVQHGVRLAAIPENAQIDYDESIIGWDMVARVESQKQDQPPVTLKACFEKLTPKAVDFISKLSIREWGYTTFPVNTHIVQVSRETLGYITSALVSSALDDSSAETCIVVYRAMTAHTAFSKIRKDPYYEKVRKVRNELKAMWGNLSHSATEGTLKAIETDYMGVFNKEAGLRNLFKVITMAAKDDRYTKVLAIIEEDKPYDSLHKLGDFAETRLIMLMSPARDQFQSYMAKTAVDIMSSTSRARPRVVFPPRIDMLITNGSIMLDKSPAYQTFVKSAIGISNDTPEITSMQACAADQFLKDCIFGMGKIIFKRIDIDDWSDEDLKKVLSEKTIKVGEETRTIDIIAYTDNKLKEIHDTMSPSTEYKKIQWKELMLETHYRIEKAVHDAIRSYITTNKISMFNEGGFVEQEFSPIAAIFQLVVKSMFATDEEFEETSKQMGKITKSDRDASEKCAPIALMFDHVDANDREEIVHRVYRAFKRIPKIVQTFGSRFLFYVRDIDLTSTFIVQPIYTALKDEVFGKTPQLMACASFLARDFLFAICQAAGHQDASTYAAFADKVGRAINCHTDKCNFIYQEPEGGGGRYHQVDTSTDQDMYIQIVEESQPVASEEGNSLLQQPVTLISSDFKVTIFSAKAKTLEDFSKEKILAMCDDEEVQYIPPPTEDERQDEETEDKEEEAGQASHTARSKAIADNQFLHPEAKAQIHLLISWIGKYLKKFPVAQKELWYGIHAAIPRLQKNIIFTVPTNKTLYTSRIIAYMVSILEAVDLHKDNKEELLKCTGSKTSHGKGRQLTFNAKLKIVLDIIQKEWGATGQTDNKQDDARTGAAALINLSAQQNPQTQQSDEEDDDDEHVGSDKGPGSDEGSGSDSETGKN